MKKIIFILSLACLGFSVLFNSVLSFAASLFNRDVAQIYDFTPKSNIMNFAMFFLIIYALFHIFGIFVGVRRDDIEETGNE